MSITKSKIAFDVTGANTFGSYYHIKSLVKHFEENEYLDYKLIVFCTDNFFLKFSTVNVQVYQMSFCKNIFFRIIWSTLIFPIVCFAIKVKIIYSPFDIGPFYSFGIKIILGIKNPNSILPKDLVTLRYPKLHMIVSYISSLSASKYLFPSQFALESVGRFLANTRIKGTFVHHGLDFKEWSIIKKNNNFHSPKKYIFFCSSLYKFKNIEVLLKTLEKINSNIIGDKFDLIICGKFVCNRYRNDIYALVNSLKIQSNVIFYNNLDREKIIYLYKNAEVNVIPTLFETFGHMYLEAIQSGSPVLVGDIPVAHEILGDSVIYFPPKEHEYLANLILSKKYSENLFEMNFKRSEILKKFSIYNECMNTFKVLLDSSKVKKSSFA
ncbi:MAG: glycosyltransferase [Chitinophagaceae bacterium]|nr:MAG: glycosyltransferase [Chitinophagaceae bacterium]